MPTLTVLGSINADHVISVPHFAKPGETLSGTHYRTAYGGKGANQAVAAAKAADGTDIRVAFIGCIGNDDIGRAMKQAFADGGIDVSAVNEIADQSTGIALIQVAASGENSIVIAAGANAALDETAVVHAADKIRTADCLLMQLETPLPAVLAAARLARRHGVKTVLNPAPACPLPSELLACTDIITPNETETHILTGIAVKDEATAQQAADIFHHHGIGTVIITLGSKGIFVSQKGSKGQALPAFTVQAADTTAAGDTFNGALMIALLQQTALIDAVRFAMAAAAISVTRQGAQPSIPSRQEILDFQARQG